MSKALTERVQILDLSHDRGKWDEVVASWRREALDVYFSSGYHRAFAPRDSAAKLFVFEVLDERLVYPFLLRPIESVGPEAISGAYHDIETVYGFTGPVSTTSDRRFLDAAWQSFDRWCSSERVIAEFVRFNPFLGNQQFAPTDAATSTIGDCVVLDLRGSEGELWQGYTSINRNMIRKAERHGVTCSFGPLADHISEFTTLYHRTMERSRARSSYYFTMDQFAALAEAVPCFVTIAAVDGAAMAMGLFLTHDKRVHYHLAGSVDSARQVAANNLLLHRTVLEVRRLGFEQFNFGGGRTDAAADSLLKFKANFSRQRREARIGTRVHDPDPYRRLCALRRSQTAPVADGYFLAYRYETKN